MKVKQLNTDTGNESSGSCMFAKHSTLSQLGVALELAVHA